MSLVDYIPNTAEVNKCIKPVAEGAHEAVLLAVHQPTPLSSRLVHKTERVRTNEAELLAHILTEDIPTGALVVPITGASGAGKSHLIRILEARLRSSRVGERHLIIRIPKSASLRAVVELILEPLSASKYADVKAAFSNALAEIDVESAAIRFQGELEITLLQLASDLSERARLTPTQALREQLDHANRLPLLLRDPVTSEHFRKAIFPRIVKRAVAGDSEGELDGTEGQFRTTDLDLPGDIDLGQAGRPASNYYRIALQSRDGKGKNVAAEVLNSVVDQATRQLFKLHEALGGMTLQDVILEIRRQLLSEGRDLILLVEDFAALTGIQETLARVLIQEGVRGGKAEFATMRSVIAVTDGYLVSRDTLATRAMREWIVESEIRSEEEIFERTKALVAAYLDASRWTEAELVARFKNRPAHSSTDRRDWLPVYRAEDDEDASRCLDAFGFSDDIPLFPFSEAAIQHLARRALKHGDTLVFNPRFIISEVLRRLLLGALDAFAANDFPRSGIEAKRASAEVAAWTAALSEVESVKRRYETLVVVWGDNPPTLAHVAEIPSAVFEAFGLRPPSLERVPPKPRRQAPQGATPAPVPPRMEEVEKYRTAFEEWVQGGRLPQQVASVVRKHIAAAVNEQIDWNAERCLRTLVQADWISIPNARGEDGVRPNPIKIAEDSTDAEGRVRGELISLVRLYEIHQDNEQYEGFDDDLVRVATLIERLLPQARERVRSRVLEQLQLTLLVVAGNSRLLGIPQTGKTPRALSNFLFGVPPQQEVLPDIVEPENIKASLTDWRELQSNARQLRPVLTNYLLANCGCYQGTGETVNGVDITRISESYPRSDMRLELAKIERISAEQKNALAATGDLRLAARFRAMRTESSRLRDVVARTFGPELDKDAVCARMKELASALKEMGAWDSEALGLSLPAFQSMCEVFRASALKEAMEQVARAEAEADSAKNDIISILVAPLLIGAEFSSKAEAVLTAAERRAKTLEEQFRGTGPEAQVQAIQQSFKKLEAQLRYLQ